MNKKMMYATALGAMLVAAPALAQDKNVKIGVLNDMSSLYADIGGPNSVVSAKLAVEDSGLEAKGWKIEVVGADHQNKPDIGVSVARQWIDVDKVDMITDTPNSGVALAIANLSKEKNIVHLNTGGASSDLTGKACTPNTMSMMYDTYMLANGTGKALTKAGGNTPDFSSFLLQAQTSKAKVVGLANAGGDTTNAIKQAAEFGIVAGGQKLAGLLMFINDVNALGLKTAQGLTFTESYYWDMNDDTRAFAKRFAAKANKGQMPSMSQAGVYAAVKHYLAALEKMGGNPHDGAKVVAKMKELPAVDKLFGDAPFRADGRRMVKAYLFEVKKPEESKYPWDYYKTVATIPAEEAARPLAESECPLIKK